MITIVGAGKIGSACALSIVHRGISDVTMVDIQEGLAQGETLDITQASPSIGFDGVIKGSSDFADMAGSELVIITAGYPRKPNTSRRDLALGNAKIITSVVREVVKYAPECNLMIVTNPVDAMTYIAYKRSGFHRSKVFGMSGILDNSRYRSYLASELNISYVWFRTYFKKHTGFSPYDYQLNIRINHARLLLKNSSISVKEISQSSGFESQQQFSKTFKKKSGQTPVQFRKQ